MRKAETTQDGCGYLLLNGLSLGLLLALNGLVVAVAYAYLRRIGWVGVERPRLTQAILFLVPPALVFLEWRLLDRVRSRR